MSDNEQKNIPPATPENAAADSPAAATPTPVETLGVTPVADPNAPVGVVPLESSAAGVAIMSDKKESSSEADSPAADSKTPSPTAESTFADSDSTLAAASATIGSAAAAFSDASSPSSDSKPESKTAAKANATKSDSDAAAAKVAASSDSKKADAKSSPAKPAAAKKAAAATPPKKVVKVRRRLRGVVSGNRADKTARVRVMRQIKHPVYQKFVRRHNNVQAHDENNACQVGDAVIIEEAPRVSKTKGWRVVRRLTGGES